MAEKREKSEEEEVKIPVFTVLKNGGILKNIFLNNRPPPPESETSKDSREKGKNSDEEDEKLLVGRHPECHIVLDHPSISRFHLQIWSHPASKKLFVVDLSSVHGTWVSDRKIEPQVAAEMMEGDTLRLGASTRIYSLQWVPLSCAFEFENPILSSVTIAEGRKEGHQVLEIPSAPPMPESMNSSSPDEACSVAKMPTKREDLCPEEVPFATQTLLEMENNSLQERRSEQNDILMPESINFSSPDEACSDAKMPMKREDLCLEEVPFATQTLLEMENNSPQERRLEQNVILMLESIKSSSPDDVCSDAKIPTIRKNTSLGESGTLLVGENKSPQGRRSEQNDNGNHCAPDAAESMNSMMPIKVLTGDAHSDRETYSPKVHCTAEIVSSVDRENISPLVMSEKQKKPSTLWSRRCKSASFPSIQAGQTRLKMVERCNATIDIHNQKENTDVEQCEREKTICKVLFSDWECQEESFLSDKENMTPITSIGLKSGTLKLEMQSDKESMTPMPSVGLKSMIANLEIMQLEWQKSSSENFAYSDADENVFPSGKENLMLNASLDSKSKRPTSKSQSRFKQEMIMTRRAERVPFQSLLENSDSKSKSISIKNTALRNCNSVGHSQTANENNSTSSTNHSVEQAVNKLREGKKKWNMVVDTSCLLDEESRRSLKLLEGLKGTHLIIPRMVIRELDCLKRRGSRFRKANEASSILQWIEECMVKTRWWIHVQSSAESMRIAPTPPASPQTRLSEGSNEFCGGNTNSVPFSTCGSLMEIVTPTAEDHILECALLYKRIKNDGQFVLLTNDIALKIKAMAEGLICETVAEFHESLVNPYSKRFLWVESTPIGPTWSSRSDDGGLENYNCWQPALRKTGKVAEGVKGLKLILQHNSHYGQTQIK